MQDRYTLTAGGKPFAALPAGARDAVMELARQVAAELQRPVTVTFGAIEVAKIQPALLSRPLPADAEAKLRELMRQRRLARPDGTPATAMHETLAFQHPPAVPDQLPPSAMPILIEPPIATSTTAAWLAYRDTCVRLMRTFPLDPYVKSLCEAANRALAWRASIPPEQCFWEGAEEEVEGYTFVIDHGRASRWVPAPISMPELIELAHDVADDFGGQVVVYRNGLEIARVPMRQAHAPQPRDSSRGQKI